MLFHPFDTIFSNRTKVRLLRALAPIDRPVSGREAAALAGVAVTAKGALDELVDIGLLTRQETNREHLYRLSREHVLAATIDTVFAAERRYVQMIFDSLAQALEHINQRLEAQGESGILAASLFGSAARDEDRPDSDVDLFVLVDSEPAKAAVYRDVVDLGLEIARAFGRRLSPVVVTRSTADAMAEQRDPLLLDVIRHGRRIFGRRIEELVGGATRTEE